MYVPVQHLTPLELVKAARRASGDTADVGTANNLWGSNDSSGTSAAVADSSLMVRTVPHSRFQCGEHTACSLLFVRFITPLYRS